MKHVIIACVTVVLSGCATGRTQYHVADTTGGYSDLRADDKVLVARFSGNAHTSSQDAMYLSEFRAIESCKEQGFPVARIIGTKNHSTSTTVQKSSTQTYKSPTYVKGSGNASTTYNRMGNFAEADTNANFSGNVSGGNQNTESRTWNETYHFPVSDTFYMCANRVYQTKVLLGPVTPDDMKPYMKDLLGGVQITSIGDGSPNRGILEVGDILIKLNGQRIQNLPQFSHEIDNAEDKDQIPALVVHNGKAKKVSIKAVETTEQLLQAGNQIVATACAQLDVKVRPICSENGRVPANSAPSPVGP